MRHRVFFLCLAACLLSGGAASAQENPAAQGKEVYDQAKAFRLAGGSVEARGLVLKRDRAVMTFDGTFYFAAPVEGRVTGAVFVGQGTFRAEVPPSEFEKENVKRLLNEQIIESDFKTAVLRFTDDTLDRIGKDRSEAAAPAPERAQKLASELDARFTSGGATSSPGSRTATSG